MVIPQSVVQAMLDAGVVVHPVTPDTVELVAPELDSQERVQEQLTAPQDQPSGPPVSAEGSSMRPGAARMKVKRWSQALSPSHIRNVVAHATNRQRLPYLLIAPSASKAAMDAAAAAGWSVVTVSGRDAHAEGFLQLNGTTVHLGLRIADGPADQAPRRGPKPYGTYAIMRQVLLGRAATQEQIAQAVGVTQSGVSRRLRELADKGLIERVGNRGTGWRAVDVRAAVDWWLETYPGPGGVTTYWYGLNRPNDQVLLAVGHLAENYRTLVSGDVAVDVVAPWRRPIRARLYVTRCGALDVTHPKSWDLRRHARRADGAPSGRSPDQETVDEAAIAFASRRHAVDLGGTGLVQSGPDEATLEVVLPADFGVWSAPAEETGRGGFALADVLQIAWDLARSPGPDVDQALQHFLPVVYQVAEHAIRR